MMQEVSTDDNNGESTFEFIERRVDDLHVGSATGVSTTTQSQQLSSPQSERIGSSDQTVTSSTVVSSVNTPTPLPSIFSQSPAPIPTFAVSSLPPPPLSLPSFINVSEPTLTAFPAANPILSPYNPGSNQQQQQPFHAPTPSSSVVTSAPMAVTSLDLPFSDYGGGGTRPSEYENVGGGKSGGVWGWIKGTVSGNEFLNKVAEKAKNSVDSVITTLDPQMSEYIYSGGDVQFVVASDKEVKVEPIREALCTVFGRATVVVGIAAQSSVAAQPVGFSAGLKGAEDRISALRQSGLVDERHPIIAVENALIEVTPDSWFDVGCLVLDDRVTGRTLHSYTQLVPVPNHCVQQLQNDTPADYPLRWSGFSLTIGQAVGLALQVPHAEWHQHVAGVSRRDMILMAAKVLATTYQRLRDSTVYSQSSWMG